MYTGLDTVSSKVERGRTEPETCKSLLLHVWSIIFTFFLKFIASRQIDFFTNSARIWMPTRKWLIFFTLGINGIKQNEKNQIWQTQASYLARGQNVSGTVFNELRQPLIDIPKVSLHEDVPAQENHMTMVDNRYLFYLFFPAKTHNSQLKFSFFSSRRKFTLKFDWLLFFKKNCLNLMAAAIHWFNHLIWCLATDIPRDVYQSTDWSFMKLAIYI